MRWLILSIFLLTGCATAPDNSIPAKIVEWSESNVWQVVTDQGGYGSAFWISPRHALTNCHVVRDLPTVVVENNSRSLVLPMSVRSCNMDEDIALLVYTPEGPAPFDMKPTRIADENPERGQMLYGIGYPLAGSMVITSGHYQGYDIRDIGRYVITTPIIFGDSGGPAVYLNNGEVTVIGIRSGIRGIPSGFGATFYITHLVSIRDSQAVQKFIKDNV